MSKRTRAALYGIIFIAFTTYISLWAYSVQWFNREIDNIYANAEKEGVEFLGEKPTLSNFPFVPVVTYTNGIKAGNASVLFPLLVIRGYPIPFTTLSMTFPQGIALNGIADPAIWSLDSLKAELAVPYHLPSAFKAEDLAKWRNTGGKLEVREYALQKGSLLSGGKGLLTLDKDLQPVFYLESTVRGYDAFIAEQKDKNLIDPFAAAVGATILNGLAATDDKSGEKTVTVKVSVENRLLSVGPLQVLDLPRIVWDTRTQPDRHL